MRRLPAFLVATALAILWLACARSPYTPSATDGGSIYREACAPCHEGTAGHSLRGLDLKPEAVERRLRWGGRGMPAFPRIEGEARRNLALYVAEMSRSRE
ncbi:MAG: c-type cytochrome [Acidobacteriota bacterium]